MWRFSFFLLCIFLMINFAFSDPSVRDPFLPINTISTSEISNTWIPLYFAKSDQVLSFLSKPELHLLSENGKINADTRTNQIWIADDAMHIRFVRNLIQHLDKRETQFLIHARIINIDKRYQHTLGIFFQQSESKNQNNVLSPQLHESSEENNANQFSFAIVKLPGNRLLNLQLSALEQDGHATLISSPALMTLNNQAATIESGAEVPYQEATSSGATSVSFKKAVLSLKVTPIRIPHHQILLNISLNQDRVSALTVNGVPAIETQKIATQVIVHDNQTIVLGGILETSRANEIKRIPIIESIPILGALLQHHTRIKTERELLIFITPQKLAP